MEKSRTFRVLASCFWLLSSSFFLLPSAFAQSPITAPWVKTPEVNVPQPTVPPVTSISASVVGNTGNATYYYWVVPNFNFGQGPVSSPVQVNNAPSALTGSNYVAISWVPPVTVNESQLPAPQTAVTYDVLRTSSPNLPNTPATIAVATGLTGTTFNDQGSTLTSYTLNPLAAFDSIVVTRGKGILHPIMSLPAAQLPFYAQYNSIGFETDGVSSNPVCNGGGSAFVLCRFDQTLNEWVPVFGTGGGSCFNGATDTQYVDSRQGSDSNSGLNWCAAKLTEQAAVNALLATGGWVYEAPNYTGASATGVPANIHILRTAQTDAHQATSERLSFLDQTQININTLAQFLGVHSTTADAIASWTANNAFRSGNLQSAFTSMLTTTGTGIFGMDTPAVLGIANMEFLSDQAEGVEGICAINGDNDNDQDCTGVVGVAASQSGSVGASSLEGMWSEIRAIQPVNNVDGYVVRLTGGNAPPSISGGIVTAAFDIRSPFTSVTSNDIWPNGLYMEDSTTNQPIYLGIGATYNGVQRTHLADWGNNGINFGYFYDGSVASISQIRVAGSGNVLFPFGGDFQFINQHANGIVSTTTVSLQTNATGNISVDAINAVSFSATPNFDRSLGKIQKITLTANVTSSTLSNCFAGQTIIFDIVENGTGGFTFVAPANLHGFGSITTTANFHNRQMFYCDGSSTNSGGYSVGTMQSGT